MRLILALSIALALSAAASEKPGSRVVVALLQIRPAGADLDKNRERALDACRKAARHGADIAVLPELFSVGYTAPEPAIEDSETLNREFAFSPGDGYLESFARAARELEIAIAVTYLQRWEGGPRNAITLFDRRGKEVFTYAKVHTCDFNALEANTTPGDDFPVGELDTRTGTVKVGAMICYDREFPESARILMLRGAEIVLTPNASVLDQIRIDQTKVRAWENAIGIAVANYPAPLKSGGSHAYAADGSLLVRAGAKPGIFYARFDLEALRAHRSRTIMGDAYRRPHHYTGLLNRSDESVWVRQDFRGDR